MPIVKLKDLCSKLRRPYLKNGSFKMKMKKYKSILRRKIGKLVSLSKLDHKI